MSRPLTEGVAGEFLNNYRGISDPNSFSYNDNYCGAYLDDKTAQYGFKNRDAMAKACRKLLKIEQPVKKQPMRIEVVKFMGKFGSFASSESVMYRAELVGVNGKRQDLGEDAMSDSEGHPEIRYANQTAKKWANLLGCPITHVDKTAKKATV